MIKSVQLLKVFTVVLSLAFIFSGCDETETYRGPSNYFPLSNHLQWAYQWEYGCGCPERFGPPSDPAVQMVTGDTVINGKTYSKIENEYGLVKIARQDGEQYFTNLTDGTEFLFLDTDIPVGSSWSVGNDEFWKHRLFMRKHFQQMTVNAVTYHDVLVVEDEYSYDDGQYEFSTSTFHYYANGIGEILTYYAPSPYSYNPYGYKSSLLKFK